jgi:uncharacterized cupin superfamily protein
MADSKGWKVANINNVPPFKASWSKGWHSIRHHFGITGFGVNAATRAKGESITPEHDEVETGQQELFIVIDGKAEFILDGKKTTLSKGDMIAIEPEVKRQATALTTPTVVLTVGGTPGKAYEIGPWEK